MSGALEPDDAYRERVLAAIPVDRRYARDSARVMIGAELDVFGKVYGLPRLATDPFGEAVRDAQDHAESAPRYRPDDFMAPDFDREAAYRRAMGGGP